MDIKRIEELMLERQMSIPIYCYEELDSTNEFAKGIRLHPFGASFVLAAHQTAGKGRQGRSFHSPYGGVYLTYAFSPKHKSNLPLTVSAAVCVCDAVEKICGIRPEIKWTNDILLNGKKLCGILAEAGSDKLVIGVGLNLNTELFPDELKDTAISLYQYCGREFDFNDAAVELMYSLFNLPSAANIKRRRLASSAAERALAQYRKDCTTVGKTVDFRLDNIDYTGIAESIGDDGALNVRLPNGTLIPVRFGAVTVR